MALVILARHAVTDQTGVRLYGTSPGVLLSDHGRRQAEDLAGRLAEVPLDALYSSPLERCVETARAVARGRGRLRIQRMRDLAEVEYGDWTGRTFTSLRRLALWRRVHRTPSAVRFPGGESLAEVQLRAVRALETVAGRHPRGIVAMVTHGDVIRLALAHAAGIHLDLFQRLEVDPASVSAVSMEGGRVRVVRVNDTGGLATLAAHRAVRG